MMMMKTAFETIPQPGEVVEIHKKVLESIFAQRRILGDDQKYIGVLEKLLSSTSLSVLISYYGQLSDLDKRVKLATQLKQATNAQIQIVTDVATVVTGLRKSAKANDKLDRDLLELEITLGEKMNDYAGLVRGFDKLQDNWRDLRNEKYEHLKTILKLRGGIKEEENEWTRLTEAQRNKFIEIVAKARRRKGKIVWVDLSRRAKKEFPGRYNGHQFDDKFVKSLFEQSKLK